MATTIDEKTEVTLPLKIVISMGIALISATAFVYHIEGRIDNLETTFARKSIGWDAASKFVIEFKPHPLVNETADRVRQTDLEIIKLQKDIEHLQKELNDLKRGK
jgi:cell division protein FtsL